MLVDDDPDTLQMLTLVLEEAGGEVKPCGTAAEALETLDGWEADLLVSDLGMPNEDGYALIRKMRARESERGAATPAIALTAFASASDRNQALEAGFEVHLSKPVEPLELVDAIAQLAGTGRRERREDPGGG